MQTQTAAQTAIAALIDAVSAKVRDDGSGDLGVIVREAYRADPAVTVAEIVATVREARADAKAERAV